MALEDRYITATPEGVSLSMVLAGLGSRIGAYVIDFAIQCAVFLVVVLAVNAVVGSGVSETTQLVEAGFVALIAFLDFIGYFVVCELVFSGRSIGKRAAGLRVVRIGGAPVGFWSSVLRNVLRLIDWMPFPLYLVGSVLILSTTQNQRLGDLAGNTVVIRERTAAVAALRAELWNSNTQWMAPVNGGQGWYPIEPMPPAFMGWDVSAVRTEDVTLITMFLANRFGYAPEARAALAAQLANRVWPLVGGAPATLHPEQFLESVAIVKSMRG